MLKFDSLDEAVEKSAILEEFCCSVRIVNINDGSALYTSNIEKSTETKLHRRTEMRFDAEQQTYEISSLPIAVGETRCALEMIQPYQNVISQVASEGSSSRNGQKSIFSAVGDLIHKDKLTGLFNRRYIDEALPDAIKTAEKQQKPFSIIFADIDRFKDVNDQYGHITGDLILQHVAHLIQNHIRKTDSWVARYGGDEFLICLQNTDLNAAKRIANRLRMAMMGECFVFEQAAISLTCSFGVQSYDRTMGEMTAAKLLQGADEMLYEAKNAGRNAVR